MEVNKSVKRKWIGGAVSLLLLGLAFGGGWWARMSMRPYASSAGSSVVVQRDFTPMIADARTPKSDASVSEPSMVALYWRVLDLVKREYVEPVDETKLMRSSLDAMLTALDDPHSQYMEPQRFEQYLRALNGEVSGIGAVLNLLQRKSTVKLGNTEETVPVEQRLIQVVAVLPGSPAEKAGLKSGDLITEIDGQWVLSEDPFAEVVGLQRLHRERQQILDADRRARERLRKSITISEAIQKLTEVPKPKEKPELTLKVQRGGQTLEVKVSRALTKVKPVEYGRVRGQFGYIRLNTLNVQAEREFTQALRTLQQGGAKGLVIDLRQTAIGQQEPALKILSQLVRTRRVGTIEYREGSAYKKRPLNLPSEPRGKALPIAVLVDQGTYNVAELVALALKTGAKARLFGVPTAGDAAQTALYRLKDNSAFTLTVGRYYGADGSSFDKRGVQPDERIAAAPTMRGQPNGDPALDKALAWLTQVQKEARS